MNGLDLRRRDFISLYSTAPSIISFLENSIDETEYTKKIDTLKIPLDKNLLTVRMNKMEIEE